MLRATSSPIKPQSRSSDIAQRLHDAAEIDSQYDELENARMELERARKRKIPPPPSSPRTRALNRVVDIVTNDLRNNSELDNVGAQIALRSLKSAVQTVLHEHLTSDQELPDEIDELPKEMYAGGSHAASGEPGTFRRRLPFADGTQLALRSTSSSTTQMIANRQPPPALPGRTWSAMITSASLQFNKAVEYEIRSELTSVTESPADVVTGTCVVRRRYRDFDRLRKMLSQEVSPNEFVLIPNLPPKDAKSVITGNRADPQFVWDRRVALFFWLRYLCGHHAIRNSSLLRLFLWESSRASTSTSRGAKIDDNMNPVAEKALWDRAFAYQQKMMEYRFGNSVVALTSMATHIKMMIGAYQRASSKALNVVACDRSLARSLLRASRSFGAWAEFEKSAGQNYGFVAKFADVLPSCDFNRPHFSSADTNADSTSGAATDVSGTEEALVSFAEKHSRQQTQMIAAKDFSRSDMDKILVKDQVEIPESVGAFCDTRSLKAFHTLLHMWGDDVLPRLEANLVDPKKASPYYEETKNKSDMHGTRVACEWTELEHLKREMLRDGAVHLVLDQIRHAQAETRRWKQLQEAIRVQETEISSLVALGDVSAPPVVVSPPPHVSLGHMHDGRSSSSSSARSSPVERHLERIPSRTSSSAPLTSPNSMSNGNGNRHFYKEALDENLDEAQAIFREQQEHASSPADEKLDLSTRFQQLEESRYLNPFFSDEDD